MTTGSQSAHPLAGETLSGADIIMQVLSDEGIDTIFGYSGGAILPTYDAVFRFNQKVEDKPEKQVRLVVPANEQGAGFMAAGYARASGKVGVCLVTSGPGATNTVTPVRDSMADSVPMVVICGQVAVRAIGTDAFQEAPIANIMSACAKHVFLVTDPTKLEATIRTAFEIARTGRPGPVVIDIPKDVQNWYGAFKGEGQLDIRGYRQRMEAMRSNPVSDGKCQAFFDILQKSERPLIYAGGGVINSEAAAELTAFAEKFNIPVVTTLMGIGGLPTKHRLCLKMLGMHGTAYANYAVEDCDFLIAIGSRFDDRVAGQAEKFAPLAKHIAHVDIDASEIRKVKKNIAWHHVGDAKETLIKLMSFGKKISPDFSKWLTHVDALRAEHDMDFDRASDEIQPQEIIEIINEITQGNAIIATGVGQHQMWAAQYCEFNDPRLWLTSGSMGTMGFGLPAAIGAQAACPDKVVIDIDGDGSIRMNLGELETATTYDLPVKVLLFNNVGDGMVRQWQKTYLNGNFSGSDKSLHKKNFVKAAEADGFGFAQSISTREKMKQILEEFIAFKGAAFLEVMIDKEAGVFPMVGPGMTYAQMITGDHIKSRAQKSSPSTDPLTIKDAF